MNEGWVFDDGDEYAKYEEDALAIAKSRGFDSLQNAFDEDAAYWTQWEMPISANYEMKRGVLIDIF